MINAKNHKTMLALSGDLAILLVFVVGFSIVHPARGAAPAAPPESGAAAPSDLSSIAILDDPSEWVPWVPKVNGCLIDQIGSIIRIYGTNNIDGWGNGNGITSTKYRVQGNFYASVDFMVPQFKGSGNALVYLRAKSTNNNGKMIAILYQPNAGTYKVQGWGVGGAANTFSRTQLQKFGDESKAFHRMKLEYDAAAETASGWIDDKFIGSLHYSLTDPVAFEIFANTDKKGMQIDLFFDNLFVTSEIPKSTAAASQPLKKMPDVDFNPGGASMVNAVFSGDDTKQEWAQTFTVNVAGVLAEIDLSAKHFVPTRGNLVMDLRRTYATGVPTSRSTGVLYSTSVDTKNVPQTDDGYVAFDIASRNIRVKPGEKYAVVLHAGENASTFKWLGLTGNPYVGGGAFDRQASNDGSWVDEDGCDLGLRTFVLGQTEK
jgi:hypothetical protein